MAGVILLIVAAVALLDRYSGVQLGLLAPGLLGFGFLGWAWIGRQPVMLIPAGILLGLGAGWIVERSVSTSGSMERALFFGCFAAGWILITVLSRWLFRQRVLWPLIPAAAMAVIAGIHLGGARFGDAWRVIGQSWPFLVLIIGVWLLLARSRRR